MVDNLLHPNTYVGVVFITPENHPLDVRGEIEYSSARFKAVAVIAAMQKAH